MWNCLWKYREWLFFISKLLWLWENEYELLCNIFSSWRKRLAGHVALKGKNWNSYRYLIWKSECERTLGKPRRRRDEDIKVDLQEIGFDSVKWLCLAQHRLYVRFLRTHQPPNLINTGNCLTSSDTVSCLRRTVLYNVSYTIRPFTQ